MFDVYVLNLSTGKKMQLPYFGKYWQMPPSQPPTPPKKNYWFGYLERRYLLVSLTYAHLPTLTY